jgi:CHAT domain-containing protein
MRRRSGLCLLAGFAAAVTCAAAQQSTDEFTLERCAELVREEPERSRPYRCYWSVARDGFVAEAVRALDALLSIESDNPMALYYLAQIERDRGSERALELYRRAASAFADRGNRGGEGTALFTLADELSRRARPDEAQAVLERALEVARASGNRQFLAKARQVQSRFYMRQGDYGAALRVLHEAERVIFPDGPLLTRMEILSSLAQAYLKLDRVPEALECYRRKVALPGNPSGRSEGSYEASHDHYAITRLSAAVGLPSGQMSHDEYVTALEDSLDFAVVAGNKPLEATIRRLLGTELEGPESIEQLRLALEIARSQAQADEARASERALALAVLRDSPEQRDEAFRLMDEALEQARSAGDPAEIATALTAKAELLSLAGEWEEWRSTSRDAVAAVEDLLDRQPESGVRARTLHKWAHVYLRFSGLLLARLHESSDFFGDLDLAYRTVERMRGRVLLEELSVAGIDARDREVGPEHERLADVLAEISRIQRVLADPGLEAGERSDALAELDRLEEDEAALRDSLARTRGASVVSEDPSLPELREVRDALAPDQAILSFQLSRRSRPPVHRSDQGGSWLLLITARDAWAYPLEDKDRIEKQVRMFLGLCRRGEGSEIEASIALYRELLEEALREAGPEVRRLVLVPDGALHRLPFAALRPEAEGRPLGAEYEITEAPSVTLWLSWKDRENGSSAGVRDSAVLALADPDLPVAGDGLSLRSADPWVEGLRLDPLPRARVEAEEMVRQVGGASRMLVGPEATERFLKQTDLAGYDILHVAAHAVVDYDRPVRSAILLGPGAEEEDGFLQSREIAGLNLDGKVVILSACRSASGQVVRGEGVLGLGRAFFRAGSRAVVGNLWPMRDEDAESFVRELSRHLAAGESLASAVRAARQARLAAGAPAAAWAGVVLLGDGDFVPVAGSRGRLRHALWLLPVVVAILLAAAALTIRRRRSRGPAAP